MPGLIPRGQPGPGEAEAEGVVGAAGDQAERGEAAAGVLAGEQGVGVVRPELVEAADAAVVDAGGAEPEPLGAEEVRALGPVQEAAAVGFQAAGLPPEAEAEVAGLALRAEAIGVADLADVKKVAVEMGPLEAGLAPIGDVAVVEAVIEIERFRRG